MARKVFLIGALAVCSVAVSTLFAGHNLFFARKEPAVRLVPTAHVSGQGPRIHIPILVYHSVRPDFPLETKRQKEFSITPDEFEQQLAYLQTHGYQTISPDELVRDLERGTTTPVARPVVLTFDDGWQSQYTYALPLLQKYHDTATFYIYTNPIDHHYPMFLTWDEVKALDAAGMTIGAHTISHPYLSKLSEAAMRHEVTGSKEIIESHLGKPVLHFASPFGYDSAQLETILQDSGFVTGRTTHKGAYHEHAERLHLTAFLAHRDLQDFIWALEYAP